MIAEAAAEEPSAQAIQGKANTAGMLTLVHLDGRITNLVAITISDAHSITML